MWRDANRTIEEIQHFSVKDARKWAELSEIISVACRIGLPMMMTNPIRPEPKQIFKALKAVGAGRKQIVDILRWVAAPQREVIEEYFEHDMVRAPLTINLPFMHFGIGFVWLGADLPRRAAGHGHRDVRGRHRRVPRVADPLPGAPRRDRALLGPGRRAARRG